MKLWSGLRFGSVGVMLAGVGSAISGCSAEDAIRALLVLLALALGGGAVEETTIGGGTVAASVSLFDNFTATTISLTDACETNFGVSTPITAPNQGVDAAVLGRGISNFAGASTANTALDITVGSGSITIDNSAGANVCNQIFAVGWGAATGATGAPNLTDMSSIFPVKKLTFTVSDFTGVFTAVQLSILDANSAQFLKITGNGTFILDPATATITSPPGGDTVMDWTAVTVQIFVLGIPAGGKVVVGPITLE